MKIFSVFTVLMLLFSSTHAFAQGKTRAEVEHELAELESVGYDPSYNDPQYPQAIMDAEAKLAQKKALEQAGSQALSVSPK